MKAPEDIRNYKYRDGFILRFKGENPTAPTEADYVYRGINPISKSLFSVAKYKLKGIHPGVIFAKKIYVKTNESAGRL